MTWTPISGTVPQYQKSDGTLASGYYLKFYESGSTTALSMATNSTGGTTLAKCQINSSGYPINGSGDVFIPHISKDYKIVLYKNSTDADADTTGNAEWVVDANKQTQTGDSDVWNIFSGTPTQTSAITFTLSGDQRTTFSVGTKLKLTDASTIYGIVTAVAYSSVTTVTVLATADLSGSLSAVEYAKTYDDGQTKGLELDARTYVVTSSRTITNDFVIPKGCLLSISASQTLTISGSIDAGLYQIFTGSGTVTGFDSVNVYPQWWGAVGDGVTDDTAAFTNAIATGRNVYVPNGIYLVDSITISNRCQNFIGEQMGTIGLSLGVTIRCRSSITNFFTVESNVGMRVFNINVEGNNLATNTVRVSNNITDLSFEFVTISGCVDGGVNLNLQPKTPNTQVSEIAFHRVLLAGRSGGTGITNMLCDSNQYLVNSFYDCKIFGNSDGDVSKNIDIRQGQINMYTPFFTGLTASGAYDIAMSGGAIDIYSGRSESSAVDSIFVTGGSKVNLYDYVHGSTISNTTYAHTAGFTGKCKIVGGVFTNISLTGTGGETLLVNPELYSGGVLSGTGASSALIIGNLSRSGRAVNEIAQAALTNLQGISSADESAKNLTSSFSIANTDTTASVTFATAESDALYHVFITPYAKTGSPAAGAFTVTDIAKTTAGFTVTVSAAPGASTDVSYAWFLVRYG